MLEVDEIHPAPCIVLHYSHLPRDEVTAVQGIPVTTVPRALLDLAAVVGAPDHMLNAAGWRVVRITWRQLHEQAEMVAADLVKRLGC